MPGVKINEGEGTENGQESVSPILKTTSGMTTMERTTAGMTTMERTTAGMTGTKTSLPTVPKRPKDIAKSITKLLEEGKEQFAVNDVGGKTHISVLISGK